MFCNALCASTKVNNLIQAIETLKITHNLFSLPAAMTTYHVYVHTGNKLGAGTDANVYVVLFGGKDDTGTMFLKSSKTNKNKFERNQMDEFVIEAVDIGELQKIK